MKNKTKNSIFLLLLILLLAVIFNNGRIYDELLNTKLFTLLLDIEPIDNENRFTQSNGVLINAKLNSSSSQPRPPQDLIIYSHRQTLEIFIHRDVLTEGLKEIQLSAAYGGGLPSISVFKISLFMRKQLLKEIILPAPYQMTSTHNVSILQLSDFFENIIKIEKVTQDIFKYKMIRAGLLALAIIILVILFILIRKLWIRNLRIRNLRIKSVWSKNFWFSEVSSRELTHFDFIGGFCKCKLFQWMIFLGVGLIILIGRFEWRSEIFGYTLRTYILSAYFFLILVPLTYFLARAILKTKYWTNFITGFVYVYLILPYYWFGLDTLFISKFNEPNYIHWKNPGLALPKLDWLSGSTLQFKTIPNEVVFFLALLIMGFLVSWIVRKYFQIRGSVLIVLMILLQTWLHLSMRSPYSYLPHFEQPAQSNYWYHDYLFDKASGAENAEVNTEVNTEVKGVVNADYPIFRAAELLFLNAPQDLSIIKGRVFPMYLSAQASYFFNSYYVWLCLNLGAWLVALGAFYFFVIHLFNDLTDLSPIWHKKIAGVAAFFLASSQGFILYVAQPMPYVLAISGISVIICSYYWLFKPLNFKPENAIAFGGILGLFMLTYEAQPWLLALLFFALIIRTSLLWTIISILIGFSIYQGFVFVGQSLGHLNQVAALTPIGGHPLSNIIAHLKNFDFLSLGLLTFNTPLKYFNRLFHAFHLGLPFAVFGFFLLKDRTLKALMLTFMLPSFLTYALMEIGESFYTQFPRLVFSAYPAIYILNAYFMLELVQRSQNTKFANLAKYFGWFWMLLTFLISNVDVFGFPQIYNFWFTMNPFVLNN